MSFTTGFIVELSASPSNDALVLTMTLPWMRSIPWACVSEIVVSDTDGGVPLGEVILVRGRDEVRVQECRSLVGYWTTGERTQLRIVGLAASASSATLLVRVAFSVPYVNAGGRPPHLVATDTAIWTAPPIGRAA